MRPISNNLINAQTKGENNLMIVIACVCVWYCHHIQQPWVSLIVSLKSKLWGFLDLCWSMISLSLSFFVYLCLYVCFSQYSLYWTIPYEVFSKQQGETSKLTDFRQEQHSSLHFLQSVSEEKNNLYFLSPSLFRRNQPSSLLPQPQ